MEEAIEMVPLISPIENSRPIKPDNDNLPKEYAGSVPEPNMAAIIKKRLNRHKV
jgi:hypothetical protein